MGIIGKSDPYVKISGVGVTLKTKVINNNLNPVWNETFNIMIDELNQDPHLLVLKNDFVNTFRKKNLNLVFKTKDRMLRQRRDI